MVYYEHDNLDDMNKGEEHYRYFQNKKFTMKNGETIEAELICYQIPLKKFYITTTSEEQIEFYADEVKAVNDL